MADLGNGYTLSLSYSVGTTGSDNKATVSVNARITSTNNAWSSNNYPGTLTAGVVNNGGNSRQIYSQASWSDIDQGYSVSLPAGSYTVYASYDRGSTTSGYAPYYSKTDSAGVTVAPAVGHVDVNPEINGVSYPSGLSGFTFNMSGKVTVSNLTDYNNTSASPGTYTATPNAKTGYTTTAASGTVAAGGNLTLVPKWSGVETAITLDSSGATSHGTTSVTGKFGNAMPTITPPSRTGVNFLGYFSQPRGQGTQYYKANGTSNATWDNSSGGSQTLYANWDFHDFVQVSQNGGAYTLCQLYVSKNGGAYTLVDAGSVMVSQNGSSYTNIV